MTAALMAGLAAGYGIAIPVGAIGILLIELATRASPRVAVAAAFGIATADGCYALLAVLGGAALARRIVSIAVPVRLVAAAVLITIAVRIAWRAWRPAARDGTGGQNLPAKPTDSGIVGYARFLGLTLLNPMTIAYFAALVMGDRAREAPSLIPQVVFVVAVLLASASWHLVLAAGGSSLGKLLRGPGGRRATGLAASILTVALGVRFLCG